MNDRDILIYSENKYTEQQQLVKKMRLFWSKVLEGKGCRKCGKQMISERIKEKIKGEKK